MLVFLQVGDNVAGYILIFLLCSTNPATPSAFAPVALLPTNLSYTSADIDRYLADIVHSLSSAGFRHFRVCTAADNAAVHRKALVLRSTPGAFPDQREDGEVGTALTRWATVPYSLWQRIGPRVSALKL